MPSWIKQSRIPVALRGCPQVTHPDGSLARGICKAMRDGGMEGGGGDDLEQVLYPVRLDVDHAECLVRPAIIPHVDPQIIRGQE